MSRKSPGILWPNLLMGPTDYHGIGNDDDNNDDDGNNNDDDGGGQV